LLTQEAAAVTAADAGRNKQGKRRQQVPDTPLPPDGRELFDLGAEPSSLGGDVLPQAQAPASQLVAELQQWALTQGMSQGAGAMAGGGGVADQTLPLLQRLQSSMEALTSRVSSLSQGNVGGQRSLVADPSLRAMEEGLAKVLENPGQGELG
jgi:hypothetical protein